MCVRRVTFDNQGGNLRKRPAISAGVVSSAVSPSQTPLHPGIISAAPAPMLLSPVFNSSCFPQTDGSKGEPGNVSGTSHPDSSSTSRPRTGVNPGANSNPRPIIQPLPQPPQLRAAMYLPLPQSRPLGRLQFPAPNCAGQGKLRFPVAPSDDSGTAEAMATAALMMLTNEGRRGVREMAAAGIVS